MASRQEGPSNKIQMHLTSHDNKVTVFTVVCQMHGVFFLQAVPTSLHSDLHNILLILNRLKFTSCNAPQEDCKRSIVTPSLLKCPGTNFEVCWLLA